MKVTVLGTGTWGTALAQLLCDNDNEVIMYGIEKSEVEDIEYHHQNSKYFGPDVLLPACPLNVLVGENSPNLCPTMSSDINTGTCFLPSCTAIV